MENFEKSFHRAGFRRLRTDTVVDIEQKRSCFLTGSKKTLVSSLRLFLQIYFAEVSHRVSSFFFSIRFKIRKHVSRGR